MNKMKYITLIIFLIVSSSCYNCSRNDNKQQKPIAQKTEKQANENKDTSDEGLKSKSITITANPVITHVIEMKTSLGTIRLVLYGKDAPKTVNNFIKLAKKDYYNGVLFHRVVKDFIIQAGDGQTKYKSKRSEWGIGGESIYGKEFEDELDPETPSYKEGYKVGTLAMANKGPNTNSSQFFICLEEAVDLEHNYTIFGRVTKGMDVVRKIASVEVEPSNRGADDGIPIKQIRINNITIKK